MLDLVPFVMGLSSSLEFGTRSIGLFQSMLGCMAFSTTVKDYAKDLSFVCFDPAKVYLFNKSTKTSLTVIFHAGRAVGELFQFTTSKSSYICLLILA